jgi:hypothetical protein
LAAPFLGDDGSDLHAGDRTSARHVIGLNERLFTGSTLQDRSLAAPFLGDDGSNLHAGDQTSGRRIVGLNGRLCKRETAGGAVQSYFQNYL